MSGKKHKKKKSYTAKVNRGQNAKNANNANNVKNVNVGNANGNGKRRINVIGSVETTTGTPKQKKIALVAYFFTMLSFIGPIAYLIFRIVFFGSFDTNGFNTKADYALMIAECVLGLIVIHIPSLLAHKFKFEIPFFLYICYIVFLYCSIFLGEAQSFYYKIPHWDTILHAMSSLMLGFFGFMFITILNRDEHTLMSLSPFFVSLFAFCFALAIGAIWEIYEFSLDGLMGFNMQKHTLSDGTPLVGHAALSDTMKDIIIDAIGALTASIIGYISLKKNKKWLIPKLTDKKARELKTAVITEAAASLCSEPVIAENSTPADVQTDVRADVQADTQCDFKIEPATLKTE